MPNKTKTVFQKIENILARWPYTYRIGFVLIMLAAWVLIPLYTFSDLYLKDVVIGHQDLMHLIYGVRSYFFDGISHGQLPILYPNNFLGIPVFSTPIYGLLYPSFYLQAFFPDYNSFLRLDFIFHHVLFGTGWYLCFRQLKLKPLDAALAATTVVASGIFWSESYRSQLQTTAWSGMLAFLTLRAMQEQSFRLAALAGFAAGWAYLASDPLVAILGLCLGVVLFFCWPLDPHGLGKKHTLIVMIMIFVMTVMVLPVQYQASLSYPLFARSYGFGLRESLSYSTHVVRILDFLVPGVLPPLASDEYQWPAHRFGLTIEWWYPALSFGLVPGSLMLFGMLSCLRRWRYGLLVVPALFLVYAALGRHVFGGEWLWSTLPPLKYLRFPERMLKYAFIWAMPCFGLGLFYVRSFLESRQSASRSLVASFPNMTIVGIFLLSFFQTVERSTGMLYVPTRALTASSTIKDLKSPFTRVWDCNVLPDATGIGKTKATVDTRSYGVAGLAFSDATETPLIKTAGCDWLLNNLTIKLFGISHLFMPVLDGQERESVEEVLNATFLRRDETSAFDVYKTTQASPATAWFFPQYEVGRIIESVNARLQMNPKIETGFGLQALRRERPSIDHTLHLNEQGRLESGYPQGLTLNSGDVHAASDCASEGVALTAESFPGSWVVKRSFSCPGLLTFPWAFVPGWRLTLDGKSSPILRVSDSVMGVLLPEGDMQVELRYQPSGLIATLLLFFLIVGACLILTFIELKKIFRTGERW